MKIELNQIVKMDVSQNPGPQRKKCDVILKLYPISVFDSTKESKDGQQG